MLDYTVNNTFRPLLPPRDKQADGSMVTPDGYTAFNNVLLPSYPRGDVSTGWPILAELGSYWSRRFEDRGTLLGLFRASSTVFAQAYVNYLEAVACTGRFSCPILHRRPWYVLVLSENSMETGPDSLLKYGDGALYNGSYRYGVPIQGEFHSADPGELKQIGVLMNRVLAPTLIWINSTDFYLNNNVLYLRKNPFTDKRFQVRNILNSDGEVVDREVIIWAFSVYEDHNYLYEHYGYIIRRQFNSSGSYKGVLNALLNGIAGGLGTKDFEWAIAAIAGLPTVLEAIETVVGIIYYDYKTVITTDLNAYIYPANSISRVAVGEKVYAGQCLVDTVSVFDLANFDDIVTMLQAIRITDAGTRIAKSKTVESSSSDAKAESIYLAHRCPSKIKPSTAYMPLLYALPINPSILGSNYQGSLLFNNMVGKIDTSELDENNVIIGKINRVDGAASDIAKFWNTAHSNGIAAGQTWLAKLGKIPTYINPAGWVIEHFLRNNAIIVYLRYTRFGEEALGLDLLDLLRQSLLPEKLVIFIVDVELEDANAFNYETMLCPAVDSSSSSEQCGAVTHISAVRQTSTIIDPVTQTYGYLGDLEPLVFYPSECN